MDTANSFFATTSYENEKPMLRNAKLLYVFMAVLLIVDWVLPQYFGIHLGFDFTGTRIMNLLILFYFVYNRKAGNLFFRSFLEVQATPYLALYMVVMVYTTILRVSVNTFFLNFLDILTFYMVYYGIRYVIGLKKAVKWTVWISWFLAVYGVVEYILGESPMIKYLMTLPNAAKVVYRSGQYRIMGPCVHSIAYGMMLLFLMAVVCIDVDNDEIYLLKHPVLYILLFINMFLTGSRGPLGLAFVETFLIVLFSKGKRRQKTWVVLAIVLAVLVSVLVLISNTSIGQYILMQITSIIDQVFGTSLSAKYGADTTLLNQSTGYRAHLWKIFQTEWLNPIVGRGAKPDVGFEIDGAYIHSIDNFYVATYIRYAYPGLITFALFQIMTAVHMLRTWIRYKSGISIATAIGFILYSVGLFWVDYLQTTKYMFIVIAFYAVHYAGNYLEQDNERREFRRNRYKRKRYEVTGEN